MGALRGRPGFDFAQQKIADAAQRNEGKEPQKLNLRKPVIEVVDESVTAISPEDADEALRFAEEGYPGNVESEENVN